MGTFTKQACEFKDIPLVKNHRTLAAAVVGQMAVDRFDQEIEQRLESNAGEGSYGEPGGELAFDSPLEAVFWIWWVGCQRLDVFCEHNIKLRRHDVNVMIPGAGQYEIDFVVESVPEANAGYLTANWPLIGIELDGHAFHERTPEQATYRNQRDRALQQAGWHMFHFSFAEFTAKPEDCLWEVIEFVRTTYWRVIQTHLDRDRAEAAAPNKEAAPVEDAAV